MFTKRIHVFKAGDQTSAQGVSRTFSPKELDQVVKNYDPSLHEAPLVLGHQGDNDSLPSYGWIQKFERQGDDLYADVAFTDIAKDLVKDGHYRKVSISFYSPDSLINPHKGQWSARHLALLGASPPAVKGLEPFNFREWGECYDFAVALSPEDIFDNELGPTLIVEKSPLEMLRDKLSEVRQDVLSAVGDLQQSSNDQKQQNAASVDKPVSSEIASPDNPSAEYTERSGKQGTEIAQQTAELEDNLPEDQFMEDGKISRKRANGANGQVMQVVENVYDEQHKESTRTRKAAADRSAEAKRQMKEGRKGAAHETEELEKMETAHRELPEALKKRAAEVKAKGHFAEEHSEPEFDEVSYKTNPSPGVVKFGKKKETDGDQMTGRYETARSDENSYEDRMKTGKSGADGNVGRFADAKSGEQDMDRMHTSKNAEQSKDRMHTSKEPEQAEDGADRWAGQSDNYERVNNMDQYDVDAKSYGVNAPKTSDGTDPYGRKDADTKMPTESEEMPDDEIFAVSTVNVMSDGSMRVIRQKSSDARAKSVATHDLLYAEPKAAETTGPMGVTAHGEFDQGDIENDADLETLREKIGDGKKSKSKQLTPGAMDTYEDPAQIVGPSGAFAESYRGEPKAKSKQLTPAAMDTVTDPDEITSPRGVYAESLEGLRESVGDGKKSTKRQLTPGAMDDVDTEDEVTMRSGGVTGGADHGEKVTVDPKKNYTKTGFGSTYDEGEGDSGVDEGEEDYNELSADHCGMGSQGQARAVGFPEQMYDELQSLKAKYAELERKHAEEKMNARREKMAGAIGHLYTEGRLTDGIMPEQELISYCEGLEFGTLEFSEGETAATKLLTLLSKLPPMVHYGEVAAGGTFQYAEEDLDPHTKALKLVETEGLDYVEALKRTMFS